jgi:hypothetical protein
MREVPIRYVKANQIGIVLFVVLSFLFNQPLILGALWIIQVIGLASGGKLNLFVQIGKAVLTGKGTRHRQWNCNASTMFWPYYFSRWHLSHSALVGR